MQRVPFRKYTRATRCNVREKTTYRTDKEHRDNLGSIGVIIVASITGTGIVLHQMLSAGSPAGGEKTALAGLINSQTGTSTITPVNPTSTRKTLSTTSLTGTINSPSPTSITPTAPHFYWTSTPSPHSNPFVTPTNTSTETPTETPVPPTETPTETPVPPTETETLTGP